MKIDFSLRVRPEPVVSGQQEAGHEGVVTRCDDFSLLSSVAIPTGAAPALQSILKPSCSHYGCTLIFLKFLLMSQPLLTFHEDSLLPQPVLCLV